MRFKHFGRLINFVWVGHNITCAAIAIFTPVIRTNLIQSGSYFGVSTRHKWRISYKNRFNWVVSIVTEGFPVMQLKNSSPLEYHLKCSSSIVNCIGLRTWAFKLNPSIIGFFLFKIATSHSLYTPLIHWFQLKILETMNSTEPAS